MNVTALGRVTRNYCTLRLFSNLMSLQFRKITLREGKFMVDFVLKGKRSDGDDACVTLVYLRYRTLTFPTLEI